MALSDVLWDAKGDLSDETSNLTQGYAYLSVGIVAKLHLILDVGGLLAGSLVTDDWPDEAKAAFFEVRQAFEALNVEWLSKAHDSYLAVCAKHRGEE